MGYKRQPTVNGVRQRRNESDINFKERIRYYNTFRPRQVNNDKEYKTWLISHNFEYVEVELEKDSGKTIEMIIPSCIFKVLTKADINKLFKVK